MLENDEKLHKVYLLCPQGHEHVRVGDEETVHFKASFDQHLEELVTEQPILFEDDVPHHWRRSLKHNEVMLILEVPSESIVSVNGQLFLEQKKINPSHITGAYLADDVEQLLTHQSPLAYSLKFL